jgi:hypothetical protein
VPCALNRAHSVTFSSDFSLITARRLKYWHF